MLRRPVIGLSQGCALFAEHEALATTIQVSRSVRRRLPLQYSRFDAARVTIPCLPSIHFGWTSRAGFDGRRTPSTGGTNGHYGRIDGHPVRLTTVQETAPAKRAAVR